MFKCIKKCAECVRLNLPWRKFKKCYTAVEYKMDKEKHNGETKFENLRLTDLNVLRTLGKGSFGRVELVETKNENQEWFALKIINKHQIMEANMDKYVLSEIEIMLNVQNKFVISMYTSFEDHNNVYMLLETCIGGDLRRILEKSKRVEDHIAKFYSACIIEGIMYLHGMGIAHRDLKPENILLNSQGFLKLGDFGLAKQFKLSDTKTWTHNVGTTMYMAPEIILGSGHDKSVDYWSLGAIIYELLEGETPFYDLNEEMMCRKIIEGIGWVTFPSRIKSNAEKLITTLCSEDASDRLVDFNSIEWYEGFAWGELKTQPMTPPLLEEYDDTIEEYDWKSPFDYPSDEIWSASDTDDYYY